nr:PREDICTED: serine/threonine-protein kinase VRK1-like isoform X1 [Bemisia tabaci]
MLDFCVQLLMAGRGKKATGYAFPDPLPAGEVLKDFTKREWKIGASIGKGGFGEIYDVTCNNDPSKSKKPLYIAKIEPKENGPLFVEKTFYMKVAKEETIEKWMKDKKLKYLGVPKYISSGTHEYKATKYRFLITEKFGEDLYKIFLAHKKSIPLPTVLQISIQLINILEYLHANGFVHRDIKGTNILVGQPNCVENQVFLIDYGLATRLVTEKEFKPNPKQAHDGTIEYCSRDAHHGVASRRGDFEMLGYNILEWLGNPLPWVNIKAKPAVHAAKNKFMDEIPESLKNLPNVPDVIVQYFNLVSIMTHCEEPNYDLIRDLFSTELKALKVKDSRGFVFDSDTPVKKKKATEKRVLNTSKDSSNSAKENDDKPRRGRKVKKIAKDDTSQSADEVSVESQNHTPARKPRKKKSISPSKKWTNCPTMVASGVARPGTYVKRK